MEKYLRVNLLGPGLRLMKKEFTGPRSHKGSETLPYMFRTNKFIIRGLLLYTQHIVFTCMYVDVLC